MDTTSLKYVERRQMTYVDSNNVRLFHLRNYEALYILSCGKIDKQCIFKPFLKTYFRRQKLFHIIDQKSHGT